jgi:hypothetical protein
VFSPTISHSSVALPNSRTQPINSTHSLLTVATIAERVFATFTFGQFGVTSDRDRQAPSPRLDDLPIPFFLQPSAVPFGNTIQFCQQFPRAMMYIRMNSFTHGASSIDNHALLRVYWIIRYLRGHQHRLAVSGWLLCAIPNEYECVSTADA